MDTRTLMSPLRDTLPCRAHVSCALASRSPASRSAGRLALTLSLLAMAAATQAEERSATLGTGQSDFGGVGIMQTPTARMAPLGSMNVSWSRTQPYRRYNVFFQPTEWFEGGFRYVEVESRTFGSVSPDRTYLDKGFDMKLRLLGETRYWPELALGFRDLGGTTLFGAEYLAASKRFGDIDLTLGLGWGYLGNQSDVSSPFGWIDGKLDDRPSGSGAGGGDFALDNLFRGPMAVFGGVEYQTPWERLVLQLEVEGNDYSNEPLGIDLERDSRVNLGARVALTDNLELRSGWQRGDTGMLGLSYQIDLAGLSQPKRDPAPADIQAPPRESWAQVAEELEENAGMRVARISRQGSSLHVEAEPKTYRALTQSEGRAGRILHAQAEDEVERFHYRWENRGMPLRENVHPREAFVEAARSEAAESHHRHSVYGHASLDAPVGNTLHAAGPRHFEWSLGPRLDQNFGGPDGYLFRLQAVAEAEYRTDRNGWFAGELAWTAWDNLDNYEYIADSDLPRVRTFIGDYLSEASLGIERLQYTRTAQLGDSWYAMGYGGLLEMMYAGAGGELLYRPFGADWAVGMDVNWVRQRDFDQRFELRDYSAWTGHLTAYVHTGIEDVLAKVSVGRYLARDFGATLDLSREFASGARMGAWGTWTDAGDDFGEGNFDKGLYVSVPLDAFFTRSSREHAEIRWQPLTRDGGATLNRRDNLYDLTEERSGRRYWEQYDRTWE